LGLSMFFYTEKWLEKMLLVLILAICGIALVLTYSRTGYLALMVAGGIIAIFRSKFLIFVGVAAFIFVLVMSPRTFTRITEGMSIDATGMKRIESWSKGVKIIPSYPLLGTGYNTFASVQDDLGTVDEFDVNNRGGLENSMLTILVTTGILGLIAFASIYILLIRQSYLNWKNEELPEFLRGVNLGVMAAVCGFLISSITINSLLYSFLLIYFWIMASFVVSSKVKAQRSKASSSSSY